MSKRQLVIQVSRLCPILAVLCVSLYLSQVIHPISGKYQSFSLTQSRWPQECVLDPEQQDLLLAKVFNVESGDAVLR